jgi:hypothetical protein
MADIEKHSLSVKQLLAARGVSSELSKRIQEADADGNGEISIEELVVVLQSEQKAKQDVRLFRNIVILLAVSLIILIAATAGVTYGTFSSIYQKIKYTLGLGLRCLSCRVEVRVVGFSRSSKPDPAFKYVQEWCMR